MTPDYWTIGAFYFLAVLTIILWFKKRGHTPDDDEF